MEASNCQGYIMAMLFNHAIVFAKDKRASASFFASVFGLPDPVAWGPFLSVALGQGGLVQFAEATFAIQPQHYAFLVTEEEFDGIYQRILAAGLEHWADPQGTQPGTFNRNHGGRGVYFRDPAGHGLEALTRPYGSES
jgi:catechol 2,3-dioxygenase-like lactoylglutathione lyase family enzyme